MMVAGGAAMVVAAYLVGAIPIGVLLARRGGVDLRAVGSGNIGATNVGRALGRRWGLVCLVLDIGKGLVPTAAAGVILHARCAELPAGVMGLWVLVGLAAVLGHVFSVFLGFGGGKGVATSIGVGLGVFPYLHRSGAGGVSVLYVSDGAGGGVLSGSAVADGVRLGRVVGLGDHVPAVVHRPCPPAGLGYGRLLAAVGGVGSCGGADHSPPLVEHGATGAGGGAPQRDGISAALSGQSLTDALGW